MNIYVEFPNVLWIFSVSIISLNISVNSSVVFERYFL
jgi:hypothetical protein